MVGHSYSQPGEVKIFLSLFITLWKDVGKSVDYTSCLDCHMAALEKNIEMGKDFSVVKVLK